MRLLLAFLGLAFLTAATPAPKPVPVATTASGTYVLGSAAARVKLVEYASYTCSHCADFSTQSQAVLKGRMIASGSTSLEFRHMIRDRLDLAAAVLARCAGPRNFFPTSAAIFATQQTWLKKGAEFQDVKLTGAVVRQSERFVLYEREFERLKGAGRVYACFETPQELDLFEVLLEQPDHDLYEWIMERADVPPEFDGTLLNQIKAFRFKVYEIRGDRHGG